MALLKNTIIQGKLYVDGFLDANKIAENHVPLTDLYLGLHATADSAKTLSATLPINKGGTGATDATQAIINLAKGLTAIDTVSATDNLIITTQNTAHLFQVGQLWETYKQKTDLLYLGINAKAKDSFKADKVKESLTIHHLDANLNKKDTTFDGSRPQEVTIPNNVMAFSDQPKLDAPTLRSITIDGQTWNIEGNGIVGILQYEEI